MQDPAATLRRAAATGDVCRIRLGFVDMVALHHPDHLDHVFRRNHRNYVKEGPAWRAMQEIFGYALPVVEGELWLRQRRTMQPKFRRRELAALTPILVESLAHALDWRDVDSSWRRLELGTRMPDVAMGAASATLMGLRQSGARTQTISTELRTIQTTLFSAMLMQRVPRWVPMPGRRRFHRSIVAIHDEIQRLIDERRRETGPSNDLLGLLIAATDDQTGAGMTDQQLREETVSLFLAGYEATSTALQWSLALLGQNPHIWDRLCEECDGVLRGEDPTQDDLPRLSYARWVAQEATRLYPPIWWIPRVAATDDQIANYAIPKGTEVTPVLYTIHRHPEFWTEPERFEPERFEPRRVAGRHPLAWFPFGGGPRKCIGQELALLEASLMLAMFTQRYMLAPSGHHTRPEFRVALRPANGVWLRIRRRPRR